MSVECSGVAGGAKAVTSKDGLKGAAKSSNGSDGSGDAGFSAVLTSVESDVSADGAELVEAPPVDAKDAQFPAVESTVPIVQAVVSQSTEVPAVAVPVMATDLAILLSQAGQASSVKPNITSGEKMPDLKGVSTVSSGSEKRLTSTGGDVLSEIEKQGSVGKSLPGSFAQAEQGPLAPMPKSRGAVGQSGVSPNIVESRVQKMVSSADVTASAPTISSTLMASGLVDSAVRPAERSAAKPFSTERGSGSEGNWGYQSLLTGNRVDAPAVAADSSAIGLESMVADTVSYWVTQGVQSAELKLDGLGEKPVQVSITLRGDEAHVDFRTDQPEVRQMLEGAVSQLKDLLVSEGLVLSGVSVGASGQDRAGSQERRNEPGVRQVIVSKVETVPLQNLTRINSTVGRSVDLFV